MVNISGFLRAKAKKNPRKILFPESKDSRILEAVKKIKESKIADPVVLSDIENSALISEMSEFWSDMKKILLAKSTELMENRLYLATALLYSGKVDGMVAGANHPTSDVLKPVLEGRKLYPGIPPVTSCFFMQIPNFRNAGAETGLLVFADCALNPEPSPAMLAHIAGQASLAAQTILGLRPKTAFLSYSTKGSAKGGGMEKIQKALEIARSKYPGVEMDGELQPDAALIDWIGEKKAPSSAVAGKANVLIFPDLNSGNIAYKLVERLAKAKAVGPIILGLHPPVNDLSRGCSVEDIIDVCAVTSLQSQAGK